MIIVKLMGGMGDQMFEYALGRALSLKLGVPLKLDLGFLLDRSPRENFTFHDYDLNLFHVQADIATLDEVQAIRNAVQKPHALLFWKRPKTSVKRVREPHFHFTPEVLDTPDDRYLDGYWQSPKYFEAIADTLRQDFTLQQPMDALGLRLAEEIADRPDAVCLNVRRADFVNNPVANELHGACDMDYYERGIARMREHLQKPHFYVFSDDVAWCREQFSARRGFTVVSHDVAGDRFGQYLQLMSLCKHYLIPNSAFAWWAAWLNPRTDKHVIAPRQWFHDRNTRTDDIFPERWEKL